VHACAEQTEDVLGANSIDLIYASFLFHELPAEVSACARAHTHTGFAEPLTFSLNVRASPPLFVMQATRAVLKSVAKSLRRGGVIAIADVDVERMVKRSSPPLITLFQVLLRPYIDSYTLVPAVPRGFDPNGQYGHIHTYVDADRGITRALSPIDTYRHRESSLPRFSTPSRPLFAVSEDMDVFLCLCLSVCVLCLCLCVSYLHLSNR
jgi:hypothetical protein